MEGVQKMTLITKVLWIAALFVVSAASYSQTRTTTFFHHDAQGSVIAASDESGTLLWRKQYMPYGDKLEGSDDTEAVSYTGHVHDDSLELTYMKARWYDPTVGRFTGIDPAGVLENAEFNPALFNRYAYANNNPYRYEDPTGKIPVETIWDGANVALGIASFGYNVSQGNYGSAAVDAGGVLIDAVATVVPYVPGGASSAIKAGRGVDSAVDGIKACCCFTEGTPVLTLNGSLPIETLRAGDVVYSKNIESGELELSTVTASYITEGKEIYELVTENLQGQWETIHVTDNHPYWVQLEGWVDSGELTPGMQLKDKYDQDVLVISLRSLGYTEQTYNIEVEGNHNYFAGDQAVLVHNCNCNVTKSADNVIHLPHTDKFGNVISRNPKSIQDQMTLDAAKSGEGIVKIPSLSDPKFKGMQKMELETISAGGKKSNVHFVRDPATGETMDFKFKKHSTDRIHNAEK